MKQIEGGKQKYCVNDIFIANLNCFLYTGHMKAKEAGAYFVQCNSAIKQYASCIKVSGKQRKCISWITQGPINSVNTKQELYREWKQDLNNE